MVSVAKFCAVALLVVLGVLFLINQTSQVYVGHNRPTCSLLNLYLTGR